MAIDRWDPFREMLSLRDAMDRFMQEGLFRPTSAMLNAARGGFPIDVTESDDEYVVKASLPGVRPDDLHVQVEGNTLTIRGERKAEEEQPSTGQWLMREHRAETFIRSVTLPMPIEVNHSKANYEHGILSLTLPKAESAKPKQIPVMGKETSAELRPDQFKQSTQQASGSGNSVGEQQSKPDVVRLASEDSFPASDPPSSNQTSDTP